MSNPIREVIRNVKKQAVRIVFNDGHDDYIFIFVDGHIVCSSAKKLDEMTFKKYRKQFRAIFLENRIIKEAIRGKNTAENTRLNLLKDFHCYVLAKGKVLIVYNHDGKTVENTYKDIDSSIRAQDHIMEKYFSNDTELKKAPEIIRLFSNIKAIDKVRITLFDWKNASETAITASDDVLSKTAKNLERCRNELKKSAHAQLEKSAGFIDSTGKKNPGAVLARTCVAENKIQKRTEKIKAIDQYTAKRKTVLQLEKKQMQLNIIEASFKLKMILHSSDAFFQNKEVVNSRLGQVLYLLQSIWLNPYLDPVKEARKDILEAKNKISKNKIGEAKKFISRAINLLLTIQ